MYNVCQRYFIHVTKFASWPIINFCGHLAGCYYSPILQESHFQHLARSLYSHLLWPYDLLWPLKMTHYITPKEGQSLPRRGLYLNRWNLNFRLDKSYTFCESPFFRHPTPFNARTTPLRTLLSTAQPPERRTNLGGQFRRTFIRSFQVVLLFIRSFCFFATLSQMTLAL